MSNLIDKRGYKSIVVIADLVIIFFSYVLAFYIRYEEIPARNWQSFLSLSPWILLTSLFFITIYELYSFNRKSIWDLLRGIFVSVTFISFITMSVSFLVREFALPRSVILLDYFITIILLVSWKALFMKIARRDPQGTVLLIADEDEAQKLISQMKHPLVKVSQINRITPSTPIAKINELIQNQKTSFVLLSSNIEEDKKAKIIYFSMKCNKMLYVVPSLYDLLLSKSLITSLDDTMVIAVKPFGLTYDERVLKRILDILASGLLLVWTSPVMLLVWLIIKLESPRSKALYKQLRVGENNKEFILYKFRSMVENAEKETGPVLAVKNDARITKIGKFLRVTRLDELPQLVNVLKGNMSLVGPRPEREHFIKILSEQHHSYHYRNTVKPGITGYAQVMGRYTTDVEDKLRFDLYYIRNYSLWLDIIILLRTFVVLLDRTKAEGTTNKVPQKNISIKL